MFVQSRQTDLSNGQEDFQNFKKFSASAGEDGAEPQVLRVDQLDRKTRKNIVSKALATEDQDHEQLLTHIQERLTRYTANTKPPRAPVEQRVGSHEHQLCIF